jgi:hypothetical protein
MGYVLIHKIYTHIHTETEKHTELRTCRHTDKQTYRHTDVQTYNTHTHTLVKTYKQIYALMKKYIHIYTIM